MNTKLNTQPEFLAEDGFADGGVAYTDEELATINQEPVVTILFKARVQDGNINDPGCALLEMDANTAKHLREVITKAQQALAVCPDARSIEIWALASTLKDFDDEDASPFYGNYDPMFVYADGCPFELSDHEVDCLDALVVFSDGNEFCFRGESDDDGLVYKTHNMPIADLLAVLPV